MDARFVGVVARSGRAEGGSSGGEEMDGGRDWSRWSAGSHKCTVEM